MKKIKKLLAAITVTAVTTSLAMSSMSVSALEYGSEWGGRNQFSGNEATVTAPPAANGESTDVSSPVVSTGTYSDVPSTHWAYDAVERCSAAHWFDGYPNGTFLPNGEILRGEAMKVFVQILGLPLSEVTNPTYYDVKATDWYAPYIEVGQSLFPERTALDGQKKFQPEMPITREDAIYALVQTLGYADETKYADESVLNMFTDQKSISTNLRPYMAWAISDGLASGYDDGTIGAQEPLTRAEFATILYRANVTHGFNNTGFVSKVTSSITIDPSTYKEIVVGESFEITAVINYSDGSSEDYTNKLNPYADGSEGIVTVNKNKVTGVGEGTVIINYNAEDEAARSQSLVVKVNPDPNAVPDPTPEPTVEPTPEPVIAETAGMVKANVDKEKAPVQQSSRYTVLVLDVSGSMASLSKMEAAKSAALSFCDKVLSQGTNDYIAVVKFETDASVVSDFTNDIDSLNQAISSMSAYGLTNIDDAYSLAGSLLDGVTDDSAVAKSIIFMTDGYPEGGAESSSGKYTSADLSFYQQANVIYNTFTGLDATGYDIYTIGFQTNVETEKLLRDIQNRGFYYASDSAKLENIFDKMADIIIVAGVNVELKKDDLVIDSCSTTEGACDFSFTVNPDTYLLEISAPGYEKYSKTITVGSGETIDLGAIVLSLE